MTSLTNMQDVSLQPGIQRLFGILLGVSITSVVLRVLWPVIPERKLTGYLSDFFANTHSFLKQYTPHHLDRLSHPEQLEFLQNKICTLPVKILDWVDQIGLKKKEEIHRIPLKQAAMNTQSIAFRLQALEDALKTEIPEPMLQRIRPNLHEINNMILERLEHLHTFFSEHKRPEKQATDMLQAYQKLSANLTQFFRQEFGGRPYSGDQVAKMISLTRRFCELAYEVNSCYISALKADLRILKRSPFF